MIQSLLAMTLTCSYPNSRSSSLTFLTMIVVLLSRSCWTSSRSPCFPSLQWQVAIQRFCCGSRLVWWCSSCSRAWPCHPYAQGFCHWSQSLHFEPLGPLPKSSWLFLKTFWRPDVPMWSWNSFSCLSRLWVTFGFLGQDSDERGNLYSYDGSN